MKTLVIPLSITDLSQFLLKTSTINLLNATEEKRERIYKHLRTPQDDADQEESYSHWGLRWMRERAENIGARFGIWSSRVRGQKCTSPFRLTSPNGQPSIGGPWEERIET